MSILMPEPVTDHQGLKAALARASRIVAVTGAGISASAGIATYRDRGSGWIDRGLEQKMRARRYGNHLPELWGFWGGLRAASLAVAPTPAHVALTDSRVTVLTQNVDGLHGRAGSETVELHGSVLRTRCIRCGGVYADDLVPAEGVVPDCLVCGYKRRTRVDVVLFGENLLGRHVKRSRELLRSADVCLYVGTSGNVFPVADFVSWAKRGGAVTALVTRDPWEHPSPDFDVTLLGDADDLVPDLMG